MDDELQVDGYGVRTEAMRCEVLVGELAGNGAPASGGSTWLASQAAVHASHALVAAAGNRCAARVQATAAAMDAAATGYAENEFRAAARVRLC